MSGGEGAERRAGTLVTQSAALDALEAARTHDQRTVTATREVVRGGRGSIDRQRAATIIDTYRDTLRAIKDSARAPNTAQSRTRDALGLFREVLRPRQFETVERELSCEWHRQRGDPLEFPGANDWVFALKHQDPGEALDALMERSHEQVFGGT